MRSGIGSTLHIESGALAHAWEAGRILWENKGFPMAPATYCGDSNTTLDSCYFLPLSNCTLHNSELTQQDLDNAPVVDTLQALSSPHPRVVKWTVRSVIAQNARHVPTSLVTWLRQQGIPEDRMSWWWRAQAMAYIVRPNARTLTELQVRRRDKLLGVQPQRGCISLFVRHGDKASEAATHEDPAYEAAVHRLRAIDTTLSTDVFLSTEDPHTVDYFINASRGLPTSYVKMNRK